MSWHFSQVLVEAYLEGNCLDGEPSALLNGTHTHGTFWSPDKTMDVLKPSRSGMTYRPLTDTHGEELLTWFLEDSRAKTSPAQAKEQALKDRDQVCGNTWRELSVKFDLNTHSWKTHQCLWEEDLAPSSLTLPKWGMMQSGALWERIMSPLLINETESGFLLPTPTCADATMGAILNDNTKLITLKSGRLRKISNQGISGSIGLARHVQIWPTPRCQMTRPVAIRRDITKGHKGNLEEVVAVRAMWPTPTAHNAKETNAPSESERNTPTLAAQVGGHLNPTWVEWLMGWPLGWTDLKQSGMGKFQQWLNSHGIS